MDGSKNSWFVPSASEIFALLDTNFDGHLSPEELATRLLARGVEAEQVSELFAELDIDGDGGMISLETNTQQQGG